jgi:hypothetical protein
MSCLELNSYEFCTNINPNFANASVLGQLTMANGNNAETAYAIVVDNSNNLQFYCQTTGSDLFNPITISSVGEVTIPSLSVPGADVLSIVSGLGSGMNCIGSTNVNLTSALVAGTNITLTPSSDTTALTISASGNAGTVTSVSAGTAISVTGTAQDPIINNTGVATVTAGTNVTITGTATNPIINAGGGGGGSVTSVSAGTGAITVTGTGTDPIINNTGVSSLTAPIGSGITVNSANPLVPILSANLVAGTNCTIVPSVSNNSITINATGTYTAAVPMIWQYTTLQTSFAGGGAGTGTVMTWGGATWIDPIGTLINANPFSNPTFFTAPITGVYRFNLAWITSNGGLNMMVWNVTQNSSGDVTKMVNFKNFIQGSMCLDQFVAGDQFVICAGTGSGSFTTGSITNFLTVEYVGQSNSLSSGATIVFGPFTDVHVPTLIGTFDIPGDYTTGSNCTIQWNYQMSGLVSGFAYTVGLWVGGVGVGTQISSQVINYAGGVQPTPYNTTASNVNQYFTYAFTAGETISLSYEASGTGSHTDAGTLLISPFYYT